MNHPMPYRKLTVHAALLLVALSAPTGARADTLTTRVILTPGKLDLNGLTMDGFARQITPAQPPLPVQEVKVALHPRADLKTLKVEVLSSLTDTLPGQHDLQPNPPLRLIKDGQVRDSWNGAGTVLGGRDLDAYGEQIFPPQTAARQKISNRRGLLVLHLDYQPLRYRHSTGELLLERNTEVRVSYRLRHHQPFPPDAQLASFLRQVTNPEQAAAWYQAQRADTTAKPGYAIFITDALAKQSQQLASFKAQKEALGYSVTVVDDAARAAMPVTKAGGDSERIRLWLKANYKALNLKYVLLIGNPDTNRKGIPMKLTYAYANNIHYPTKTPSDYYYADLSGNWDLDGDGLVAEYPDDKGTGGVDFTPEVYVGRIPIYDNNSRALDQILTKTMAYISDKRDKAWRGRVLQPAAVLWYDNQDNHHTGVDGATMANAIYEQAIKPNGLSRTTLFEQEGISPSPQKSDLSLTRDNLIKEWQKGYGLVTWFGHGSSTGVYRTVWLRDNGDKIPQNTKNNYEVSSPSFFSYDDVHKLDDSRPSFVFHGSCSNGTPESANNLGYGLLLHGAIGTVSSTRVAVVSLASYQSSGANIFGVERDFTKFLLSGKSASEALFEAKQALIESMGMLTWFTRLEISLYGDPSLTLNACTKATDCDDGKKCNGAETCKAGQCVAGAPLPCSSSDPCTVAACDEASGTCKKTRRPDGEACDDKLFCTAGDTCNRGVCSGKERCAVGDNPCVSTSCDEQKKSCQVGTTVLEATPCRQGTEREGLCLRGLCQPFSTPGCSLTAGRASDKHLPWALGPLLLALLGMLRRRAR